MPKAEYVLSQGPGILGKYCIAYSCMGNREPGRSFKLSALTSRLIDTLLGKQDARYHARLACQE